MKRYIDTIMGAGNRAKSLVTQILSYSRAEGTEKIPVIVAPIAQEVCDLVRGSTPAAIDVDFVGARRRRRRDGRSHAPAPAAHEPLHQRDPGDGRRAARSSSRVADEMLEQPRKVRSGEIPPGEYVRISRERLGPRHRARGDRPHLRALLHDEARGPRHGPGPRARAFGRERAQGASSRWRASWGAARRSRSGSRAIQAAEGDDRGAARAHGGRGQVILAVDDEVDVLHALEEMLAQLGYEPVGFNDSREALRGRARQPAPLRRRGERRGDAASSSARSSPSSFAS